MTPKTERRCWGCGRPTGPEPDYIPEWDVPRPPCEGWAAGFSLGRVFLKWMWCCPDPECGETTTEKVVVSGLWQSDGCTRNNFGEICGTPHWTREGPDRQWWVYRDDHPTREWVAYHTTNDPSGCTACEAERSVRR